MYRDLFQIKRPDEEPSLPADTVRTYGPFTLFNTRAFLIQMKASAAPADTRLDVYLANDFLPGTSANPTAPSVVDESLWVKVHSNTAMVDTEPLIYEKCQTAAEWLRFRVTVGPSSSLDDLDIVLAKQAWR